MNLSVPLALAAILLGGVAHAQTPPAASLAAVAGKSGAPEKAETLALFFDLGSATVRPQDATVLDKASRLYTDGKPTVMILTGSTDALGQALPNLRLSQQRALAVLTQLVARGIPAERFQILAKGQTDLAAPGLSGKGEPRDRRVEIAWH